MKDFSSSIYISGECLKPFFSNQKRCPNAHLVTFRIEIFKKLVEIHAAGVSPAYFSEKNVVFRGNEYRIVDFDHACNEECEWKGEIEKHIETTVDDIPNVLGCDDLGFWGEVLGLWKLQGYHTVRFQRGFESPKALANLQFFFAIGEGMARGFTKVMS